MKNGGSAMPVKEAIMSLYRSDMPRMRLIPAIICAVLTALAGAMSGVYAGTIVSVVFLIAATSIFAALLFMFRRPFILASPLLSLAAAAIITGTVTAAFTAFAYAVPAAATALSAYKKYSKSVTVTYTSIAMAAYAVLIVLFIGIISGSAIPSYDELLSRMTATFSSITVRSNGGKVLLFTKEAAKRLAEYVITMLPAIITVSVSVASFFIVLLFSLLTRLFSFTSYLPEPWIYIPATPSAVIFLISCTVSAALIPYSNVDVIGYAAENIIYIFLPAMLLQGVRKSFLHFRNKGQIIIFILLFVILAAVSLSICLMTFSYIGAISLIWTSVRSRLRAKRSGDDSDNDNNDSGNDNYHDGGYYFDH